MLTRLQSYYYQVNAKNCVLLTFLRRGHVCYFLFWFVVVFFYKKLTCWVRLVRNSEKIDVVKRWGLSFLSILNHSRAVEHQGITAVKQAEELKLNLWKESQKSKW